MFPKIETQTCVKREIIAANITHEDHIRRMLAKTQNIDYKPWKNNFCPKNSHAPFGDYPNKYMNPKEKVPIAEPVWHQSQASTNNTYLETKGVGTGGRTTTLQPKKQMFTPPPPSCGASKKRPIAPTHFRKLYNRGDLPVKVVHKGVNNIHWTLHPEKLDYKYFLPIFFDGLREKMDPYRFLAIHGTFDQIEEGSIDQIYDCLPQLIMPLKIALNTRDFDIICVALKVVQKLAMKHQRIGENQVPYYRQLLPILNLFKYHNKSLGDHIEYSQRKDMNIGDLINDTLEILEKTGGEDAFINIKYMIPTYESCMQN